MVFSRISLAKFRFIHMYEVEHVYKSEFIFAKKYNSVLIFIS
ncbi:hypothetical protein UYSO10_2037 [Kosakonia radicincitans]|nr:hypothetical protein UYSO10_2037 [Kosakonia radicincitans]